MLYLPLAIIITGIDLFSYMGEYLGMKNYSLFRKMKKYFLVAFLALFLVLPVFASDNNIIQAVTISKAKDSADSYELSVDSTKQVPYKTVQDVDGSIYFELKNSNVANDIDTFYDDVKDIDNVIVKQTDRNRVRIYVKGKNAQNTELTFSNAILENNKEKIVLNRPMGDYQPTNYNDLENSEDDLQAWYDNSFNLTHLIRALFTTLKDTGLGVVLLFLALTSSAVLIAKTLSSKLSQDKEQLIGLNSTKFHNDITFDHILPQTQKRHDEMMDEEKRQETLKIAQAQLAKAHEKYQNYLQEKYKNATFPNKPKSIGMDAVKKGIALSQYQKSTKNPYSDQEVIKMDEIKQDYSKDDFKIPPRPDVQQFSQFKNQISNSAQVSKRVAAKPDFTTSTVASSPYIQRKTGNAAKKEGSMKFLESVTRIYEESGRKDLANGLKNTMSKTKQII